MFCPKCGTQVPENDRFCPTCGEPVAASEKPVDESDRTAMFDRADAERAKYLSALCYLNFVFIIIALLLEPNSKFLRYHINQSIVLYVFALLSALLNIVPILGQIAFVVASVMFIVFTIMGIVRAVKCEAKDLPIIGKYVVVHYD